jgi:hypothetical protein
MLRACRHGWAGRAETSLGNALRSRALRPYRHCALNPLPVPIHAPIHPLNTRSEAYTLQNYLRILRNLDCEGNQLDIVQMAYATPAQLQYIQAVWQSSFVRLNQGQPGISGLLNHSQVCTTPFELSSICPMILHILM